MRGEKERDEEKGRQRGRKEGGERDKGSERVNIEAFNMLSHVGILSGRCEFH